VTSTEVAITISSIERDFLIRSIKKPRRDLPITVIKTLPGSRVDCILAWTIAITLFFI
jgi:hypothetical protein